MSISPLRQRMIDDMTARHFGEKSQKDYIRCVKNLALFIGRSPDTATLDTDPQSREHSGLQPVRPGGQAARPRLAGSSLYLAGQLR